MNHAPRVADGCGVAAPERKGKVLLRPRPYHRIRVAINDCPRDSLGNQCRREREIDGGLECGELALSLGGRLLA